MELFTTTDLQRLISSPEGHHASLYMPTHRITAQGQQDPIRLKNLISQAENDLVAAGMRDTDASRMLAPVVDLQQDYEFWKHQSEGLAVFVSEHDETRYYRLPLSLPELAVVTSRFHVKPLMQLLSDDGEFFVLSLSLNNIRLLHCTRYGVDEMKLPDMPRDIGDALWPDDNEKQLQFRSFTGTSGTGEAIFHGSAEVDPKDDIQRFYRMVDNPLSDFLAASQAPLVLAGVEYQHAIYKATSRYGHIFSEGVTGNVDELRDEELRDRAWEAVGPAFQRAREQAAERYHAQAGTGRTAKDIAEIVIAASHGRVDSLFVTVGVQQWGRFTDATVELHEERQPGDEDLYDLAALETALKSGAVFVCEPGETPDGSPVCAVYRY